MSERQVAEDREGRLNGSGIHPSDLKPRASEVDMCGFAEGRVLIDATRKTAHDVVYLLITRGLSAGRSSYCPGQRDTQNAKIVNAPRNSNFYQRFSQAFIVCFLSQQIFHQLKNYGVDSPSRGQEYLVLSGNRRSTTIFAKFYNCTGLYTYTSINTCTNSIMSINKCHNRHALPVILVPLLNVLLTVHHSISV
jgi:hypothetical protein